MTNPGLASRLSGEASNHGLDEPSRSWSGYGVTTDFALVAALATLLGMAIFGWWVADRISRGVVEHAVASITLHLDSFVEPHLQDLATGDRLKESSAQALDALTDRAPVGHRVTEITIWDRNGRLVYSTDGQRLKAPPASMPDTVGRALSGSVESDFVKGAGAGSPAVLKLFAPMHDPEFRPIGVAEVHQDASALDAALRETRLQTGGLLALLSLAMAGSMFGIVRKSGRTIAQQRSALGQRVEELSALLAENTELQKRIYDANRRSTVINDRFLRRISAELHDGPVQLIALALLRLEGVRSDEGTGGGAQAGNDDDVDAIETALRDALKEIRGLSSGLSLPKLEGATIRQAIEYAVMNHESRSRTRVKLSLADGLPKAASPVFLTCVYRFIQEGLNNAVRHANGKDQTVTGYVEGPDLVIEVCDGGPGLKASSLNPVAGEGKGLGLIGLMDRIEALGGALEVGLNGEAGTRLRARFARNRLEAIDTLGVEQSGTLKTVKASDGEVAHERAN